MYKKKESNGGKLYFGPLWDFNLGFGNFDFACPADPEGWSYLFGDYCSFWLPFWAKKLTDIPQVSHEINCRWEELRAGPFQTDSLIQYIDDQVALLEDAQVRNFDRWPVLGEYVWPNNYIGDSYAEEVDFLKDWLIERLDWMDANMIGNCALYEPTSTKELNQEFYVYPNPASSELFVEFADSKVPDNQIYIFDLLGHMVYQETIQNAQHTIDVKSFTPGMYVYHIRGGGNAVYAGKFNVIK